MHENIKRRNIRKHFIKNKVSRQRKSGIRKDLEEKVSELQMGGPVGGNNDSVAPLPKKSKTFQSGSPYVYCAKNHDVTFFDNAHSVEN